MSLFSAVRTPIGYSAGATGSAIMCWIHAKISDGDLMLPTEERTECKGLSFMSYI